MDSIQFKVKEYKETNKSEMLTALRNEVWDGDELHQNYVRKPVTAV